MFDKIALLLSKALKSKTLLVNYLALIAATLTLWVESDVVTNHPEVLAVFTSALAAVNVVLRFVTKLPLEAKKHLLD